MSVEEMVLDRATDPSVVKVERAEYEIPRQFSPIPRKLTGNKFVLAGENFGAPKVKNHPHYLRSLGFDPDEYIPLVQHPGYTKYGYLLNYGGLHRLLIEEGGFTQEAVFLSDPFMLEE